MNKQDAAVFRELMTHHPSFNEQQDSVDELIQFFYNLVRDDPKMLARVDVAFRKKYGYNRGDDNDL